METMELDARIAKVREALPAGGLFHEREWRLSPAAFPFDNRLAAELEKLGYRLLLFVRACNQLYRLSAEGRQPSWIAELLDAGKPPGLVAAARERIFRDDIPRVLRPDLILTPEGFAIAELDSVPGGIGLTAWLNRTYSALGENVWGGKEGMLDGFASILPGGDILVSEEAATYRPEMEWLAETLNRERSALGHWRVLDTGARGDWQPRAYRFFELFDLPNVSGAPALLEAARAGRVSVTPPFKPALEEKLWFALFWLKPLESYWRRELGENTRRALQKVIPYSWLLDPQPLPRHAVIPRLEIHGWDELAAFSQKKRELVVKVSGFSERAWGARGVTVGHDVPQSAWAEVLRESLAEFSASPRVLQQFHHGRIVEHPYWDEEAGGLKTLRGRVRLCPYYFVSENRAVPGGALATICPDDKKLLHGMRDAILVPAATEA